MLQVIATEIELPWHLIAYLEQTLDLRWNTDGTVPETAAQRTLFVSKDTRTLFAAAEPRTLDVSVDTRTFIISPTSKPN